MYWYLAKIVFRIVCGQGHHKPQFDEQLRLVFASGKEEALEKAHLLGNREAVIFFNEKQQLVQWQFITTSELYRLSDLVDGAEIYSRIEETDHAESYVDIINKKAEQLRENNTHTLLNLA